LMQVSFGQYPVFRPSVVVCTVLSRGESGAMVHRTVTHATSGQGLALRYAHAGAPCPCRPGPGLPPGGRSFRLCSRSGGLPVDPLGPGAVPGQPAPMRASVCLLLPVVAAPAFAQGPVVTSWMFNAGGDTGYGGYP